MKTPHFSGPVCAEQKMLALNKKKIKKHFPYAGTEQV